MFKDTKDKTPDIKYQEMISEISRVLGIGRRTVISTISEYKHEGMVISPNKKRARTTLFDKIDDLDRNGLRQKVHSFWLRRELPTIDKILYVINDDPALPNFKRTSLFKVIKKIGFRIQ